MTQQNSHPSEMRQRKKGAALKKGPGAEKGRKNHLVGDF